MQLLQLKTLFNIVLGMGAIGLGFSMWQSYRTQQEILTMMRETPLFSKRTSSKRTNPSTITATTIDLTGVPEIGSTKTQVVLVELSDYQCPFCQRFFRETLPKIQEQYISQGKIRYAFVDLPNEDIHPAALEAAEAAWCAGDQGQFWRMHSSLFEQRIDNVMGITTVADALSFKDSIFEKCRQSHAYKSHIIRRRNELRKGGFTATPSFAIGIQSGFTVSIKKTVIGARPFSIFEQEINEVLTIKDSSR